MNKMAREKDVLVIFATKPCRKCKSAAQTGLFCVKCKNVKYLNDKEIICCEQPGDGHDAASGSGVDDFDVENGSGPFTNETVRYLKLIILGKDEIISGLRNEIRLRNDKIRLLEQLKGLGEAEQPMRRAAGPETITVKMKKPAMGQNSQQKMVPPALDARNQSEKTDNEIPLYEKVLTQTGNIVDTEVKDGQWKKVENTRGKKRKKGEVRGTAKVMDGSTLAAADRLAWLFVGRCRPQTTEEDLVRYLKQKAPQHNFVMNAIQKHDQNLSKNKSFRIGLNYALLTEAGKLEFWPKDLIIRRFQFFQKQTAGQKFGNSKE